MESVDKLDRIGLIGETEKGRNAELTKGRAASGTLTKDFFCLIAFISNKNESRRCALNRCNAIRLVLTALEDQCEGQL